MNRFEDSDILTKTAELLDLPMDVVAGLPNLELLGDRQLLSFTPSGDLIVQ